MDIFNPKSIVLEQNIVPSKTIDADFIDRKARLLGSLLLFTQTFYKIRTGREFFISNPVSNEPHVVTICRQLTRVFRQEVTRSIIGCPPGWHKSTLMRYFVAWCFAHYPDCRFLYVSVSEELAIDNVSDIKQIMELPAYKRLFGIDIGDEFDRGDKFSTSMGGRVTAFGAKGTVVGSDAGLPHCDRFSGGLIMDDMHKPNEVNSQKIRDTVISGYTVTLSQRCRFPNIARIFIGQRLHEDDLPGKLLAGLDGHNWEHTKLCARDKTGNAVYPEVDPLHDLEILEKIDNWTFSAQKQQEPLPPGGSIFKAEDFYYLDTDPDILCTFLTVDTAETDKTYNDATVFSFWGLYKIDDFNAETKMYALHWIDCVQIWVQPKDLRAEFFSFYTACCRYKVPPKFSAIEKKSTGVTLISLLSEIRGLEILEINRTRASGSKTDRFLTTQPFVARKQVSLPRYANHSKMCVEHMKKITANNSHANDDIADTLADAVQIGLIDQLLQHRAQTNTKNIHSAIDRHLANQAKTQKLRSEAMWQ